MGEWNNFLSRYAYIKNIPVFSALNWFDLQRVARKSRIMEFKKGERIIREGDESDAFYCLLSGRLQTFGLDSEGQKTHVEFIRRGMHFGTAALLTGERHAATVEAINDSLVLKIEKKDFEDMLSSIPQIGVALTQSLSRRLHSGRQAKGRVYESRILSVYSPTKGVGCSTYALNLAAALRRESKKNVILVSLCSTKEDTSSADRESPLGMASPSWRKSPIPLKTVCSDLDVLRKSVNADEFVVDTLRVVFDPEDSALIGQISQFVTELTLDYHFVVVDLPNQMDDVVLKTLNQSDLVQLVTFDAAKDLARTRRVINRLEESFKEKFNHEKLQVLITGRSGVCYLSFEEINREIDFDVFCKLPHIQPEDLDPPTEASALTVRFPRRSSEYAREVRKIARQISGVQVGLVLGGGAALGVAHIGVIRVLEREGIPVDIVAGSSMGALVAAFWCTGMNSEDLERIARDFESHLSLLKLCDFVFPKSGIVGGRLIKRWLTRRGLGNKTFYATRIPLKIVTYDIIQRQEIVIGSGPLVEAVRRSIAIPGVISPIREGEKVIIDGGVLNPLPTNVMAGLGIHKIIAVNVLQSHEHVRQGYREQQRRLKRLASLRFWRAPGQYLRFRMGRLMNHLLTPNIPDIIVRSLQASEYELAIQSARQADIHIHPDLSGINWFELYRVDELIERGEVAANALLPEIRSLVAE